MSAKAPKITTNIGLEEELYRKLDNYVEENGTTKRYVIKKALEEYLKKRGV